LSIGGNQEHVIGPSIPDGKDNIKRSGLVDGVYSPTRKGLIQFEGNTG